MEVSSKFHFSEIGKGWGPAILNTWRELYFIKEGQKSSTNSAPYWIAGSTNLSLEVQIGYDNYIANNLGI